MSISDIQPCDCYPTKALTFNNLLFVPHYTMQDVYLASGGVCVPGSFLRMLHAEPTIVPLWARPQSQE